jgi:single-stranded-DNA-specific exonuclease
MDSFTWRTTPFSWGVAQRFATEFDVPLLLGVVLARRGFATVDAARAFLQIDPHVPDPFLLGGMAPAVELLGNALDTGRRVVVHGDYDVDGISATALMLHGLADLGLAAEHYLPSRFVEGYGLSRMAVEAIAAAGDALLITVDCGVNYPDEVALARELGLDVIVTDHHQLSDPMPECAIVHPLVGDYPFGELCGVGVALKLLHGLHIAREGAEPTLLPAALAAHLDLVALGTVADVVPLVHENRYYVREGLVRLGAGARPGLAALLRTAGAEGTVDTGTISFRLAPRLNAAGRMESPQTPLRLLLTDDPGEAAALATQLDVFNRQRQEREAQTVAQAVEQVEAMPVLPPILVLVGDEWHEGVIGIVASRIVDRYRRPAVMLSLKEGVARGSARSIGRYDIMAGLRTCADLLTVFGGHPQAAGMTLDAADIPAFIERLQAHGGAALTDDDFIPSYAPDALVGGAELTLDTADALQRLAPFGSGNPAVRLLALDAQVVGAEPTRTGDHLRCTVVVDGVRTRGIGFGLAGALPALREEGLCAHVGMRLEANEWQGYAKAEVRLHSLYRRRDLGEASLGCGPDCPFLDPLDATPGCERCTDPYRSVSPVNSAGGDEGGDCTAPLTRLAQVLSSGEPTAVLTASVPRRLGQLAGSLPLRELGVRGVDCLSHLCWRTHLSSHDPDRLLVADWPAAMRRSALLREKRHVVVLDPPYRAEHRALLAELRDAGLTVHICVDDAAREATQSDLRYLVHPRVWMVALFRAWRESSDVQEARVAAGTEVWRAQGVLPAVDDLALAETVLTELGFAPGDCAGSTMKAEDSATYRAAVAAYEEARRVCWSR